MQLDEYRHTFGILADQDVRWLLLSVTAAAAAAAASEQSQRVSDRKTCVNGDDDLCGDAHKHLRHHHPSLFSVQLTRHSDRRTYALLLDAHTRLLSLTDLGHVDFVGFITTYATSLIH